MPKRSRADSESPSSSPRWTSNDGASSSISAEHTPKYSHIDSSEVAREVMRCQLPPHAPLSFSSYEDYEHHYQASHTNRCSECYKNFPTEHYLSLHIAENHDPLNEARRARGDKTFQCFVEDCDRFCSTPQKRKMHMIDKHKFPKFYDFFIVNDGIDKRSSMLRPGHHRRRSSAAAKAADSEQRVNRSIDSKSPRETSEAQKMSQKATSAKDPSSPPPQALESERVEKERVRSASNREDTGMMDITRSMASLKFVPPSVKFGRGRGGGGFAQR